MEGNYEQIAYADCADNVGRVSLWTCGKCGAVIAANTVPQHEEWHEKLRRAVDENESLG